MWIRLHAGVQSMTGHAAGDDGIPHADGQPSTGTYSARGRHGLPSFPRLLEALAEAWATRARVLSSASQIGETLASRSGCATHPAPHRRVLSGAFQLLSESSTTRRWARGAPKFPQPMIWSSSSASGGARRTRRGRWRTRAHDDGPGACTTRSAAASTVLVDATGWCTLREDALRQRPARVVPARGSRSATRLRRVAEETLDYVLREMTDPLGASTRAGRDSEATKGILRVDAESCVRCSARRRRVRCAYWGWTGPELRRKEHPLRGGTEPTDRHQRPALRGA